MPVGLVCPQCSTATNFDHPPIQICPRCTHAYPDEVRLAAEASLARQRAPRPVLLTVEMYWSAVAGAVILLFVFTTLAGIPTVRADDGTPARIALSMATIVELSMMGCVLLAISYALWRELAWSRPLMIFFWLMLTASSVGRALSSDNRIVDMSGALMAGALY